MQKKLNHRLIISFIALIFILLLAGCDALSKENPTTAEPTPAAGGDSPSTIIVEGRIVPLRDASLFFTMPGEISEVLVKEGDEVTSGTVLARLGGREAYQANLTSAQLELTDAQQVYNDLKSKAALAYHQSALDVTIAQQAYMDAWEKWEDFDTDDYQKKIDDAEVKVSEANDDLVDAQDEFDKYKDLDPDNTDRKRVDNALTDAQNRYDQAVRDRDLLINDRDQAKAHMDLAESRMQDARSTRDARASGPDPDDLALAQARLDNALAQVAAAQAALDDLDLIAPFSGKVVKVDIEPGDRALPNQPVIVMADFSEWQVETSDLTENEVVNIQPGQAVTIVPDALPALELTGHIKSISDYFSEKAGDVTYLTNIQLEAFDAALRWGMTVEVRIEPNSP